MATSQIKAIRGYPSEAVAWFIANVMALPAALVAYRHSPRKLRTFLTAGTAASVVASLLISSIIPFMLAR